MTTHVLWLLVKLLATVVFVNRYIAGVFLRVVRGKKWDEVRTDGWEPTVTIVVPMYNEGIAIQETLQSLLDVDYPAEKIQIYCMDDCSSDDSYHFARQVARKSGGRLKVLKNRFNVGKRRSINRAVRESTADIIVSVDSDCVLDRMAVRELIKRFTSDRIAAVGGWVDIRNKHANWLTRMQVVKYWYAYYFLKNLEWGFRRVMCLSGCLTAYRRSVLVELEPVLEHRSMLGVPIKYGEDRFLTRQVVKAGYLTTMTLDARCKTFAPATIMAYFSQQLRWRRSNIVDYAGACSHVWKLNPVLAIHYFAQFALLIAYPIAVVRALGMQKFFPALEIHIGAVALFGLYYRWRVRKMPASERVSSMAFMPLSLLMPITYALLTPLALFTLDTGSWETRGHEADVSVAEPPAELVTTTGKLHHITEPVRARTVDPIPGQAQLPAA